jgi:hypothetical protein
VILAQIGPVRVSGVNGSSSMKNGEKNVKTAVTVAITQDEWVTSALVGGFGGLRPQLHTVRALDVQDILRSISETRIGIDKMQTPLSSI